MYIVHHNPASLAARSINTYVYSYYAGQHIHVLTEKRTDGQTTCCGNTALCEIMCIVW